MNAQTMTDQQIDALVAEFVSAQRAQQWHQAHAARTQLTANNIQLVATIGGTTWRRRTPNA